MAYQNYNPFQPNGYPQNNQIQTPIQNRIFNDNRVFVQGEAGANSYPIGGMNSIVQLMDSENQIFYLKSTDNNGMIQPLRKFKYEEIQPEPEESPYVTKEELNKKFDELMAAINSKPHYYNNNKKGDRNNEQSN